MGISFETLALAKKFTEKSIAGISGSLAGKNATVEKIERVGDENTVTFKWTADDGTSRTATMTVKDGATITVLDVDDKGHLVATMSDGRKVDAGEMPSTKVSVSKESGNALKEKTDGLYVPNTGVNISTKAGNIITNETDGLYVPETDLSKVVKDTAIVKAFSPTTTDTNIPSEKLVKDSLDAIDDRIDEIQLFKFPNATIVGTPTINNGQISNFSADNYLKFPFLVDFKGKPFVIDMEFTTGSNVTTQENIFDSDFGLAFAIRNGHFVIAISSNGTNWNIGEGVGTYTVLPNTAYRVKLAWDGSQYTLDYSTDGGESYTRDITKASTEQPYPKQIFIGVGQSDTSVLNHFTGIINMNRAELSIDGTVRWQGMDDVGLATRLATDVSNIDEAGIAKVKEIAGSDAITSRVNDIYNDGFANKNLLYPSENSFTPTSTWISLDNEYAADIENGTLVHLKAGTYTINLVDNTNVAAYQLAYGTEVISATGSKTFRLDTDTDCKVRLKVTTVGSPASFKMQIEKGSVATSYVKYAKSNVELTDEIARKELELAELKMLGWTVPGDCPIQNTVNGNQFVQRVGRVELGHLAWAVNSYSSKPYSFVTHDYDVPDAVVCENTDDKIRCYSPDFETDSAVNTIAKAILYKIAVISQHRIYMYSSKETADDLKAELQGKYLYYELATPITKQIDGNEIIEKDIVTAKVNNFVKPTSDAEILALSNGIYSINVDDTSLLPSRWGTLIVLKSGYVYGSMIFITTSQEYYFRNINNGAWRETAWQKLTTTATEHTLSYTSTSGTTKSITVFGK